MIFVHILICVAYAVLYGLCGYLFILALQWLLSKLPGCSPLSGEALGVIQAIIAVLIFLMVLVCLFGGGESMDILNLHERMHLRP